MYVTFNFPKWIKLLHREGALFVWLAHSRSSTGASDSLPNLHIHVSCLGFHLKVLWYLYRVLVLQVSWQSHDKDNYVMQIGFIQNLACFFCLRVLCHAKSGAASSALLLTSDVQWVRAGCAFPICLSPPRILLPICYSKELF